MQILYYILEKWEGVSGQLLSVTVKPSFERNFGSVKGSFDPPFNYLFGCSMPDVSVNVVLVLTMKNGRGRGLIEDHKILHDPCHIFYYLL